MDEHEKGNTQNAPFKFQQKSDRFNATAQPHPVKRNRDDVVKNTPPNRFGRAEWMKKIQRQQPAQGWMMRAVAVLALMLAAATLLPLSAGNKALGNWADARVINQDVSD